MLEFEPTGQQKWPKRQQSRRWRRFRIRSIQQVAAPSICPRRTAIGGTCRLAARYLVRYNSALPVINYQKIFHL